MRISRGQAINGKYKPGFTVDPRATSRATDTNTNIRVSLQPCVGSANVGQLTIDLIVATLHLPCVGQLETSSVLPCAGLDAFDHQPGQIALSVQLFALRGPPHKPLYVLQQRAPAARGCQQQYAQDLAQWVSDSGFGEVQSMLHISLLRICCNCSLIQDKQDSL